MEKRGESRRAPHYFQICKKVGQKLAWQKEGWPQDFLLPYLFLVTRVGQLVRAPPSPLQKVSRHITG